MEMLVIILLAAAALGYAWYASIIGRRNKALEALSGIDVQLKQRFDLIPNVLQIAQKFMDHEKGLMQEITELRVKATQSYDPKNAQAVKEHIQASEALSQKMGQLMVNVENYPLLKSDQTMVQAMQTYNEVEAHIAAARRFYNSAVTALNNAIQIFPGTLIAQMAGVSVMPFLEMDAAVHEPVKASDYLR